jgi:hypothetical protein
MSAVERLVTGYDTESEDRDSIITSTRWLSSER